MKLNRRLFPLLLTGLALTLAGCVSLASDVTPPPGWEPTPVQIQPAAVETVFPVVPPNPQAGAATYAEKCAPCHGVTGLSDGPMSGQLPEPAPQLGSLEVARAARPVEWFSIVTTGNLEKLMPNFNNSLSDQQRWDVVAYAFTLSQSEPALKLGQAVYAQECQACHGPQGAGDGDQAAGLNVVDWKSEPARLSAASDQEVWAMITQGTPDGMPAYGDTLSEDERWAVTSYVRSLSFAGPAGETAGAAQETPETGATDATESAVATEPAAEAAAAGVVDIAGQVVNGSGNALPPDLQVTLTGYDGMEPAATFDASVDENGRFRFEGVDAAPGRVYQASVQYGEITYTSEVVHPEEVLAGSPVENLLVQVYDSTTDASALTADRMHLFFEPMETGTVQVVELFILNNRGNQVIVPAGPDQPVFEITLPENATNLQFQDGELGGQYLETENGFGDLHTVLPGSGAQLMFAYEIPLEKKTPLTLHVPLDVQSAVVMLPATGLNLQSSDLANAGERAVQGMNLKLFTSGQLSKGDAIDLTLTTGTAVVDSPSMLGVIIGAVVLGLALVGGGLWYLRRRREDLPEEEPVDEPVETEDSREGLLDAIITLDDRYQSGELPEEAYRARRAELKERLRLLRGEG
jgi:LPXTG-motif cell wall-anchored protein